MMRKMVRRIILGVVAVLILAVVVVWLLIDSIAKAGIEYGGTYALGVETRVDDVDVSLLGGTMRIEQLRIDNPEGYEAPKLMTSGTWDLGLKGSSLFTDTIVFDRFELNGLDLYIEQNDTTNNISEVIANIEKKSKTEEEPGGKKLRIDKIVITDVTAHVKLRLQKEPVTVHVARIELDNVGGGKGIPTGELVRQLFPAIIVAVINEGQNVLGLGFANELTRDVTGLVGTLGGDAQKMVGQLGGVGEKVATDAGKLIEAAGQGVGGLKKGVDDTLKGVNDLFK